MNQIDQWLELVQKARGSLTKVGYQEWQFIVGALGTLEERIELGKKAIDLLKRPRASDITINIKPFEYPRPMQEGRRPKR